MSTTRLRWNGSQQAQREADHAYSQLKPKKKKKKRRGRKAKIVKKRPARKSSGVRWKINGQVIYNLYMASREWQAKRRKLFRLRGRKCERCGAVKKLEVHHKTYVRLGEEPMSDLLVLCKLCHDAEHGKGPDFVSRMFLDLVKTF